MIQGTEGNNWRRLNEWQSSETTILESNVCENKPRFNYSKQSCIQLQVMQTAQVSERVKYQKLNLSSGDVKGAPEIAAVHMFKGNSKQL